MSTGNQKDNPALLILRSPINMDAWHEARAAEAAKHDEDVIRNNEIGHVLSDGSVYAGRSFETHKPLAILPADESGMMAWDDAMQAAEDKDAHGHKGWRLPTSMELRRIFNHRAAIGGFNETRSGWYWSSSRPVFGPSFLAGCINFGSGHAMSENDRHKGHIRLVRTLREPRQGP